jgi:oligoribonuclease
MTADTGIEPSRERLIWIDLEMTGLDPFQDHIIEIATIITNNELALVAEGPVIALHQPDDVILAMDEWNTRQHTASGLVQRVRDSNMSPQQAERMILEFLRQYVPQSASPMCGNSICQDRRFLARLMPELEAFFHYRNLDVSSIKEVVRRWAPAVAKAHQKKGTHLALDDIRESIAELKYYREHVFKI